MQSFKRSILIAAAIVLIAGSIILILVNKGTKEKNMTTETEIYTGTVENLIFEAGACEIEIKEGQAGQVELWYQGIRAEDISGKLENGTLKIKSSHKNIWNVSFFGIKIGNRNKKDAKICLTVPKDTVFQSVVMNFGAAQVEAERILAEDLKLTIGAGEMTAEYLLANSSAEISVGAGSLSVNGASLTNADLKCGVGQMKLSGELFGNGKVDCGVGEVELSLTTEEEIYRGNLDCGLGSIRVGKNSVNGTGKSEYGTSSAENRIDIKCGVGEVDVHFK
ncbi:MAG: DUF4097 family beta strand repeat protein [Lachnospiraceae bacterium]|nr:DUF4097 family beta strand repeat protein [Lachnospiraceae bacterium]